MLSIDGAYTFVVNGDPAITPGPVVVNFEHEEVPGGAIDGANVDYTTVRTYVDLMVFKNGIRMRSGAGNDYTETGANTFRMTDAPIVGDTLLVSYFY